MIKEKRTSIVKLQYKIDDSEINKVTYYEDDEAYILEENHENEYNDDNNLEIVENDDREENKDEDNIKNIHNLSDFMEEIKPESLNNRGNFISFIKKKLKTLRKSRIIQKT